MGKGRNVAGDTIVSLHEYSVSVSDAVKTQQHAAWRLCAGLSVITELLALFLGIGRRRFTIRTLLIATTIVALVLGLIVWLR
jgi:hypothetical protein